MILGQPYTYLRPERWRDALPKTPEGCDHHLWRLMAYRTKLLDAVAEMDTKIADLEAALAAERVNPTTMWSGYFYVGQKTMTKAALVSVLDGCTPGRYVLRATHRRGMWLVIFKDKETATIAKMFGVTLIGGEHLSQVGEVIYQPPNPWP